MGTYDLTVADPGGERGHDAWPVINSPHTPWEISGSAGFKTRVGSALFAFFLADVNVMYIPWDPTLVLHMPTKYC